MEVQPGYVIYFSKTRKFGLNYRKLSDGRHTFQMGKFSITLGWREQYTTAFR